MEQVEENAAEGELTQLFIVPAAGPVESAGSKLKAVLEAAIYITDEPLSIAQIAAALGQPPETVKQALAGTDADYAGEDAA